jgi:hypothetical protein
MQRFKDNLQPEMRGHIRIMREDNGEILFEEKNVIVNTVKWLFARLMAESVPDGINTNPSSPKVPQFGIWGLALGTGDPGWPAETQPAETPEQDHLLTQIKRKQCSKIRYVDSDLNPLPPGQFSLQVDFQTVVNATTDSITGVPIREMGLIGGGYSNVSGGPSAFTVTPSSTMLTAPYFNPSAPDADTVILINYKTLPPLPLPPGINIIFSWVLSF